MLFRSAAWWSAPRSWWRAASWSQLRKHRGCQPRKKLLHTHTCSQHVESNSAVVSSISFAPGVVVGVVLGAAVVVARGVVVGAAVVVSRGVVVTAGSSSRVSPRSTRVLGIICTGTCLQRAACKQAENAAKLHPEWSWASLSWWGSCSALPRSSQLLTQPARYLQAGAPWLWRALPWACSAVPADMAAGPACSTPTTASDPAQARST